MDRADAGRIVVGADDVSALDRGAQAAFRRRIGFVFQRFHLLPALTVLDNVAAPLLPYRTGFDKIERARELLTAVGLAGRDDALPSQLSGGQQQRVAIARALVNDPVLMLADEPTGNLDSATGAEIVQLLLDLRDERGMTVSVDGRAERRLTRHSAIDVSPVWSPDGGWIVFASRRAGEQFDLYVTDSRGRLQRPLTAGRLAQDAQPSWR